MINIRVSEIMGRQKLTQKALSEKTGIRPNTISSLWHGTAKRLEIDHLDRLCSALNCDAADLFEYVKNNDEE